MSVENHEWRWETRAPTATETECHSLQTPPPWVEDVWRLRGLVLFDGGRRPQFRRLDGQFADPDPVDLLAYHVLGLYAGELVGCIRFVPMAAPVETLTERLLGRDRFAELLAALGATRAGTVEVGRWIVHPEFRRHRIALSLVAGCWSYVQKLGFHMAVATAGTRAGQDAILRRTGLVPVPGVETRASNSFDDELRTMYAVVKQPAPNFQGMVELMGSRLAFGPQEANSPTLRTA